MLYDVGSVATAAFWPQDSAGGHFTPGWPQALMLSHLVEQQRNLRDALMRQCSRRQPAQALQVHKAKDNPTCGGVL